jgi:hypothetical protein
MGGSGSSLGGPVKAPEDSQFGFGIGFGLGLGSGLGRGPVKAPGDLTSDLDLDLYWDWDRDANVHVDSDWSGHESMTRNGMEWQSSMSHAARRLALPVRHTLRVALPGWRATRDTWHVARDMRHVTCGTRELVGHEWAGGSEVTDLKGLPGIISGFWKYLRLGRWEDRKM